jgi:polysaccharide pyruvyl transferase WcaK-like protein
MPRAARELAQSRALIDISGVSYCDGREKFLPFNIMCNLPAILFDVPVIKLSQGMGPFRGRLNRLWSCWILRRCERVFARGGETLAFCSELGLGERLAESSDIAFLFEEDHRLSKENPEFEREACRRIEEFRSAGRKTLILACSSVVLEKCEQLGSDYIGTIAAVADEYLKRGFAVVLLPNATREGLAGTRNNDLPVLQSIAAQVAGEASNLLLIDRDLNTASLRRTMAFGDFLVASRFHAMIAGLSLGIPTLVLGWGTSTVSY